MLLQTKQVFNHTIQDKNLTQYNWFQMMLNNKILINYKLFQNNNL